MISLNFYAPVNFGKAIWLLESNAFFEKSGRLSSTSPEILAVGSHCSANFQPILDCFILVFELKCEDSETIKTNHVNTYVK